MILGYSAMLFGCLQVANADEFLRFLQNLKQSYFLILKCTCFVIQDDTHYLLTFLPDDMEWLI